MLLVFTLSIFVSAALLFLVQPMTAKLILPLLGGSPSVWNTCMVFFQAMLLGGYFYSHLLSKIRGMTAQAIVHVLLLAAAAIALPLGLPKGATPPDAGSPIPWLLTTLALTAGLPYFIVSTTGPLLQRWFSRTTHPHAADPYFLYAASNAGSILGLLAYPFLIEPLIPLSRQGWIWSLGYALFGAGVLACAWLTRRNLQPADAALATPAPTAASVTPATRITFRQRLLWIALSAVPSSLMLGVTNHISTDVAAVPLLWVIPLTLYLLTFILAFSPRVPITVFNLSKILPIAMVALTVVLLMRARNPLWPIATLHIGTFFIAAWMCHGRLAASRPAVAGLTEFYLWIAVGGVLGGMFNALLAPMVFPFFLEYPIALAAALLLRPREEEADEQTKPAVAAAPNRRAVTAARKEEAADQARPATPSHQLFAALKRWALGPVLGPIIVAVLTYSLPDLLYIFSDVGLAISNAFSALGFAGDRGLRFALLLPPLLMLFLLSRRVLPFALGFLVLMSAYVVRSATEHGHLLYSERTFFGLYDVFASSSNDIHTLRHGTTMHGAQFWHPQDRFLPLTYYHSTGPIGEVFKTYWNDPRLDECAFVGLGTGTLAAYGKAGRNLTFFEIDPAVVRIASNPDYFTYLTDSDSKPRIIVGDARIRLAQEPDGKYGLIVLDAFSSDAIPVHLMTKEAVEIYVRKTRPDGLIAFHISNRYFDLSHVLGAIGDDLKLVGYGRRDDASPQDAANGKADSHWIVLAKNWEAINRLNTNGNWFMLRRLPGDPLWTDDFSNVLSVLK